MTSVEMSSTAEVLQSQALTPFWLNIWSPGSVNELSYWRHRALGCNEEQNRISHPPVSHSIAVAQRLNMEDECARWAWETVWRPGKTGEAGLARSLGPGCSTWRCSAGGAGHACGQKGQDVRGQEWGGLRERVIRLSRVSQVIWEFPGHRMGCSFLVVCSLCPADWPVEG